MPRGAVLTLEQTWALARRWYTDRLDPTWRRPTASEATAAFRAIGLSDEFWNLA